MADLTITQGDTWPPLRGCAADETGTLDLSTADQLEVILDSASTTITGTAEYIQPPVVDAGGNEYNWRYYWAAGDTSVPDTYTFALKVTWDSAATPPRVEYFPNGTNPTVEIKAKLA